MDSIVRFDPLGRWCSDRPRADRALCQARDRQSRRMNDAKLVMAFSKRCIGLSDGDKLAIASGMPYA